MPRKPVSPCAAPGCPRLVRGRLCDRHRKAYRRSVEAHRGSARERGYDTRWDKVSRFYRNRHPLCEHCEGRGRTTPGELVDHVVPWQEGGAKYDMANLQTLCRPCHARKTARDKWKVR